MEKRFLVGLVAGLLMFCLSGIANALTVDQNVTNNVIMGTGIGNGSFTVDQSNGVELGLRGKLRHPANGTYNSNGDGTYSFDAGVAIGQSFPTAVWSYEWSINTDYLDNSDLTINDFTYVLGLDSDTSQGTNFLTYDPINVVNPNGSGFWDHSMGFNSTLQSAGFEATSSSEYVDFLDIYNIAQQSTKAHWTIPGFDPTVDGTYDIYLEAYDLSGAMKAHTEIQIIVGQGGAPVPEPATMLLFGLGLVGLAGVSRKKK